MCLFHRLFVYFRYRYMFSLKSSSQSPPFSLPLWTSFFIPKSIQSFYYSMRYFGNTDRGHLACKHEVAPVPMCSRVSNKANLRDLIAATGLVILLKLDLNRRFFSPCDLEIWWMTPKNNRAPLLCYYKLFASFLSHWWIQTGITVRKRLIWVNIDAFLSRVTLKFDGWPSKTIGHLFYATSSFMHHFVAIGKFKLELESGNAQSGSNLTLFRALWPWNLTDDLQKQ